MMKQRSRVGGMVLVGLAVLGGGCREGGRRCGIEISDVRNQVSEGGGGMEGVGESRVCGEIVDLLEAQAGAWNRGDIEGYLAGYERSERLSFSAGGETHRGFEATRRRYLERYPDLAAMGRLTFSELEVYPLGRDAAYALGRWRLEREAGDVGGNFTLVLRRGAEGWRIVHDHTSVGEAAGAD